jgi:hypothetical protein
MTSYENCDKHYNKILKELKKDLSETLSSTSNKAYGLKHIYDYYNLKYLKTEQDLKIAELVGFWDFYDDLLIHNDTISHSIAFDITLESYGRSFDNKTARLLAKNGALKTFLSIVSKELAEIHGGDVEEIPKTNKYWIGKESTEFVQLIYGLIEAGRLEKANKLVMVNSIADFLGLKIAKNWDNNLSKSINNTNNLYQPSIFKDIENGWENYRTFQINKKKGLKSSK